MCVCVARARAQLSALGGASELLELIDQVVAIHPWRDFPEWSAKVAKARVKVAIAVAAGDGRPRLGRGQAPKSESSRLERADDLASQAAAHAEL